MKYWRINSFYKFISAKWVQSTILDEIKRYLWRREYLCPDFDKTQTITSPDNRAYKLKKVWNEDGSIFSLFIENTSHWNCSHGLSEPQIVKLIQDYFKLNRAIWYYLETLNDIEDTKISRTHRKIAPLEIKNHIDLWKRNQIPPKPDILEIGTYDYQQTDIYYGLKTQFKSFLDFWTSCLYWVSSGEFESTDLSIYASQDSYDLKNGSCIPMNINELEEIIKELRTKDNTLSNPSTIYLMRKDWNDKMYVLEYDDRFIMHHWHTAE
ncbi:MAG: hypothetical protein P1U56_25995 [Saprospiraceae bacterium]|nr:hypothetical protein [Saprospiraceae bacterium]